jgi:hypothetical protein
MDGKQCESVGTSSQLSDGKVTTVPPVGRKPKPRGKYSKHTTEQKQAALVEYTKIKAEQACGVKYPPDWLKMLCARHGGINPRTLRDLAKGKTKLVDGRATNKGQPTVIDKEAEAELLLRMANNNYNQTYLQIAEATGYDATTIWRYFKKNKWRTSGTRNFKPLLSEKNRQKRIEFSTKNLRNNWDFHVDIDEKIFTSEAKRANVKLPPGIKNPAVKTQSKRHMPQVMELTAIARPVPEHNFDGKIGIWRCSVDYEAKRKSKYHEKGDVYQKDQNMDSAMYVTMLRTKVFPAIRKKMGHFAKKVYVQTDSAGGHGMSHDTGKQRVMGKVGTALKVKTSQVEIEMVIQPGQSPDCNANDLGFYNSIDSMLPATRPYDTDQLHLCVERMFKDYPPQKLNDIFDSKMKVMRAIHACHGDNVYEL